MSSEEQAKLTAAKVAIGTAAGVASGLANAAAPHVARGIGGAGVANASSNFFNGATKALRSHKGVSGALAAGTVAAIHSPVIAAAVIAAAPVAAVTAVAGGAAFGIYKLVKYIQDA